MSEYLINVNHVSKKFCRSLKRSLWYGVKDLGKELLGQNQGCEGELRLDEFWAINDISFQVKRGECLGLIGSNGAGKTTLLRMLNGLIKPDQGKIVIKGRVGALIALGAGFNPILTGRENIYINASVLGFKKNEITERIEQIIEFSGLNEFLDAPVQAYSSGMQVRLGFAIAAHLDPDILLLDEVLAVGDANFRAKCYKIIDKIRKNSAIIFVSHNTEQIARVSNKILLLNKGECQYYGTTDVGVNMYENILTNTYLDDSFISENEIIKNTEVNTYIDNKENTLNILISFVSTIEIDYFLFRVWIYNSYGSFSAESVLYSHEKSITIEKGVNNWEVKLNGPSLKHGSYSISVFIITKDKSMILWAHRVTKIFIDNHIPGLVADYQMPCVDWKRVIK